MRIETKLKEKETFKRLKSYFPDIRKNGANQVMREAYEWLAPVACYSVEYDYEDMPELCMRRGTQLKDTGFWCRKAPFIPDATRLIKLTSNDLEWSKDLDFIVQFWEIENTHSVLEVKIDKFEHWLAFDVDPHDKGVFELWRCDKWGEGRRMLSSNIDWFPSKGYLNYTALDEQYDYSVPRTHEN